MRQPIASVATVLLILSARSGATAGYPSSVRPTGTHPGHLAGHRLLRNGFSVGECSPDQYT